MSRQQCSKSPVSWHLSAKNEDVQCTLYTHFLIFKRIIECVHLSCKFAHSVCDTLRVQSSNSCQFNDEFAMLTLSTIIKDDTDRRILTSCYLLTLHCRFSTSQVLVPGHLNTYHPSISPSFSRSLFHFFLIFSGIISIIFSRIIWSPSTGHMNTNHPSIFLLYEHSFILSRKHSIKYPRNHKWTVNSEHISFLILFLSDHVSFIFRILQYLPF